MSVTNPSSGAGTPGGSNHQVQYNANGSLGGITLGASGTVLTSGGVSADPTFAAVASGPNNTPAVSHQFITAYNSGTNVLAQAQPTTADISGYVAPALVLLEQHTASASATLDFTTAISATYDDYRVEFVNIVPASSGAKLQMLVSTDGATYQASNYSNTGSRTNGTGVGVEAGTAAASLSVTSATTGIATTAGTSVNGYLDLYAPGGANFKYILGNTNFVASADGTRILFSFTGAWEQTTAVTALRFLFSAGNITSGVIRIYGVAKS
jgi:hypothetical protein